MVNLPGPNEQPAREMGERSRERAQRGFRQWGHRFGRRREEMRIAEPTSLHQLEELAWRSVEIMLKQESNKGRTVAESFKTAMELLRLQYNMNFIVLCERCGARHGYDDMLMAPER
ncbi:uncharacterized protein LOC114364420 [Ostrinia furnacalis]|uniref:uncharacterized protein LOC114364420 n=1 Tax=Ostrinia furnacalis TaxID=93504 RepID=UPI001040BF14|nr:uncharacterized protein LOC114364420 [Ostrinia furnacalis]